MVKLPGAALRSAPKTTEVFTPAAMLNGLSGLDTTAFGRPLRDIWTVPAKPFWAFTNMLTGGLVPPCGTEMEVVERVREKSWGGDVWVIWGWVVPPPQPEESRKA